MSKNPKQQNRYRQIGRAVGVMAIVIGVVGLIASTLLWQNNQNNDSDVLTGLPAQVERENAPASSDKETTEETFPRLEIPTTDTKAHLETVGIDDSGNMAAPTTSDVVSRYENSPVPGDGGNTVLAGHVDTLHGHRGGVFGSLDQLEEGDEVLFITEDEEELTYRVTTQNIYGHDEAPAAAVFGQDGPERLTLITCSGAWMDEQDTYQDRLVVVAERVE